MKGSNIFSRGVLFYSLILSLCLSSCFKQEFGGLGIQVPAGSQKVSADNPFVIVNVFEGGTGERAGLQQGDIITGVDGIPVDGLECDYIVNNLIRGKVGSRVTIEVKREDRTLVFTMPRSKIILDQ
jgi:carboxyl-terminal processing protease